MTVEFKEENRFPGRPFQAKRKKRKWILLSGGVLVGVSILAYFCLIPSSPPPCPDVSGAASPDRPGPTTKTAQESQLRTIQGDVKHRSSFFKSLSEKNVPIRWIELIISKLKPYVNFKRIKGGTYRLITDVRGELVKFIYEASPTEIYELEREGQGYVAQKKPVSLDTRLVRVAGEIRSSLFEAMDEAGEQDVLTIAFADILAWEIDFYKDVREGDQFRIVVEKVYKGEQFIQYGTIHAVEYQRGEKVIRGIRYQDGYFNENGISLKKAFLKAPLKFSRISSRFSRGRIHPILGGVRPHYGIDYASPSGTPIWAVADGVVASCGWNSGFGNQVILRHTNGYTTYYGHLSAFGRGIRRGMRVKQQQVIGYVGSTGLSTGPHLDYRLTKNGQFRNPLKESFIPGVPIEKKGMEGFRQRSAEMTAWLLGAPPDSKKSGSEGKEKLSW